MNAAIYLHEVKRENLITLVENLEVVPRGIYEINGKKYHYSGIPNFIISGNSKGGISSLERVEIVVEEYTEPKTNGSGRTLI